MVDTPPSRNALDFLEAPGVLSRFLDHKVFKLMMLPTKGGFRFISTATQPILRAIGKVVGSDVLTDSVAFFQAFSGMEAGFRERATEVTALIRAPETSFVVVSSPHHDTIDEAVWFAEQLVDQGVGGEGTGADLVVVNRMHPPFGDGVVRRRRAARRRRPRVTATTTCWSACGQTVADLRAARERELAVIAPRRGDRRMGPGRSRCRCSIGTCTTSPDSRQIAGHLLGTDR